MYEPDPHAPEPEDFRALFLGEYGESAEERRIREAAAHDVLTELIEEGESDEITRLNAAYAAQLSNRNVVLMTTRPAAAEAPAPGRTSADAEGKAA
ncbi:hypothetical protein DVH02_19715 [Streptomyces corynorhini]|uniref:Uncharacterized protein n=2 Tax=Streptomyces corynorhini TaxID=2282652 RepID=A0A370B9K2_9ACTN|nr:hypothetical protein DVH02_19715 [Streptomyces corynorhini]